MWQLFYGSSFKVLKVRVQIWVYLCVVDDHRWPSAENWPCSSDGWSSEVPWCHSPFQLLPGTYVSLSHSISLTLFFFLSVSHDCLPSLACWSNRVCTEVEIFKQIKPITRPYSKFVWSLTSTGERWGQLTKWCHSLKKTQQWHHMPVA